MKDSGKTKIQLISELSELRNELKRLKTASNSTPENIDHEHYLRAILQTTADGFWVLDINGNIIDVNEAYCNMSGYTKEELVTMSITNIDYRETHEDIKNHIKKIITEGSDTFETKHVRKDGTIYDVEISASFLCRDGGRFICFCHDITDRKQSLKRLQESEENLRQRNEFIETIIDNLPLGLAANSISGQEVLYINHAFECIYGWPKNSFDSIDHFFESIYPDPEYRKQIKERVVADIISGDPERMIWSDLRATAQDGSIKYIKAQNIPLPEQDLMISTVLDVTDRNLAEIALRESEDTFRALFEAIPDIVIRYSSDGKHMFVSENISEFMPFTASDLLGKTYSELNFSDSNKQLWDNAINQVFDSGSAYETEFIADGKHGKTVFNWRLIPEKDKDGNVTSVFSLARDVTAQRQAEQNYQMLFSEMLDGFALHEIICDDDGKAVDYRYIDVNPAFERMTGLKRNDIKGKTIREILPSIEQYWIDTYGNVAINGTPAFFENFSAPLGRHYQVSAFQSAPMQFACIFVDISERKLAEQKIEEYAHKMNSIFQAAPVGIGVVSNRLFQEVNDEFCAMTGYTREELIGHSARMIYPDDREYEYVGREKYRQIKEKGSGTVETVIKQKNGALRNILMSSTPLNPDDLTVGVTFTALDMTEQKQAAQSLKESEERFRVLVESSPMLIMLLQNGKFTYVNPITIQLLGYHGQQDLIGRNVLDFVEPEFRETISKRLNNVLEGKDNLPIETKLLREDNTDVWVLTRSFLLTIGEMKTVVVVGQDISELKKAEKDRDKIQEQLIQAQKMEAVGRLAGGVAHDFNNMLNVILGNTEIALGDVDRDNPVYEELLEIKKASERSANLTRQLLAFARKQTITPQVLDLNETIEGMHTILRRLIGENIKLEWIPGNDIWRIRVDPSQIDQILANLCVNSRDAIADVGKIIIETKNMDIDQNYCETNTGASPGKYVMLSVTDTGHGMDEETMANAFEPFFTTKGVHEGTGLGLATVYGIIKQNNGFINVYSEKDIGTSMKLFMPRFAGKAEQLSASTIAESLHTGHETILLVEDEKPLLRLGKKILEELGYHVIPAETPSEAIRMATEHSGTIDLLITDVVMPEMNGLELSRRMVTMCPDIKCIYMSGYTANVIAHRGVLDKGVRFIQKPYSAKHLAIKVREALTPENK